MGNSSTGYMTPSLATGNGGGQGNEQILGGKGADIAAANSLALGDDGNYFAVTGATEIHYISTTGWTPGSIIYLQFMSNPIVRDEFGAAPEGFAAIELAADSDFQASSGDILTLAYDAVSWREVTRTDI